IVQHDFNTIVPVETLSFTGRAHDSVIWDNLTVTEGFKLDVENLTIHSQINAGPFPWAPDTLPSLQNLTNNGTMLTTDSIRLGIPGAPISSVLHTEQMAAPYISIHSTTLENDGVLFSNSGDIDLTMRDG